MMERSYQLYKIGVNYYNTRYLQLSPFNIKELEAEGIRCLNSGLNPKPLTNFNLDTKFILCFKLKIKFFNFILKGSWILDLILY